MLLKQQEDINKIRKSSQAYKDKLRQLLRGHQDVNLSSVSSALSSDGSNSPKATTEKNVSEALVSINAICVNTHWVIIEWLNIRK